MQNVDITTTYTDASGNVRTYKVKSNDLSSSWIWASSADEEVSQYIGAQVFFLNPPFFFTSVVLNSTPSNFYS